MHKISARETNCTSCSQLPQDFTKNQRLFQQEFSVKEWAICAKCTSSAAGTVNSTFDLSEYHNTVRNRSELREC